MSFKGSLNVVQANALPRRSPLLPYRSLQPLKPILARAKGKPPCRFEVDVRGGLAADDLLKGIAAYHEAIP